MPYLFSVSEISHASKRNGEQYTPDDDFFKRSMAACVFPEFVGPTCKMISRFIVRANGYHLPGFFISINVFSSSVAFVVSAFFTFFVFFFKLFSLVVLVVVEEEEEEEEEEEPYDLMNDDAAY